MPYRQLLRRAWTIVRRYPALWFFGILLLVLTNPSLTPNGYFGALGWLSADGSGADYVRSLAGPHGALLTDALVNMLWAYMDGRMLASLLLVPVSGVALIPMVDGLRLAGTASISAGWQGGFGAWLRVLVIGLLVTLLPSYLLRNFPSWSWHTGLGVVAFAYWGTFTLFSILVTVLILEYAARFCVLLGQGIFRSIELGYQLAAFRRKRSLATGGLLLLIGATGGGALTGLQYGCSWLIGRIGSELWSTTGSHLWTIASTLPLYLAVMAAICALGGVLVVFWSAAWTLAFREAVEDVAFQQAQEEERARIKNVLQNQVHSDKG